MPTFEDFANIAVNNLCKTCPQRATIDEVSLARLDAELHDSEPNVEQKLVANEAESAAVLVMTSIYKSKYGCEGPVTRAEPCECCGSKVECASYVDVSKLNNDFEED